MQINNLCTFCTTRDAQMANTDSAAAIKQKRCKIKGCVQLPCRKCGSHVYVCVSV